MRAWTHHYLGGLYRRSGEHHLFLLAGGLAFSVLVCIVPLVLILFSLLGHVLDVADLEARLAYAVDTFLPYGAQADLAKGLLLTRARELIAHRGAAGAVGSLGLLFAATSLFSSLRTVLNTVFHTTRTRHELLARVQDLVVILAILVLLLVSVLVSPLFQMLAEVTQASGPTGRLAVSAVQEHLYSGLSLVILFGLFYGLYSFLTYESLQRRVVAVSALWATLLWEVAVEAFGYYLAVFGTVRRVYGTYGLAVATVLWIYYVAILFIVAAEIGQLYRERLAGDPDLARRRGGP